MKAGRFSFVLGLGLAAAMAGACGRDHEERSACAGPPDEIPEDLGCTGLYSDYATKTIAPSARAYAPAVPFWSDGMDKDRYISLPEGQTIDIAAPDDWTFPAGTKVWKDIHNGPRKIETRYYSKLPDGTWIQGAYVWNEAGTKAVASAGEDIVVDGQPYRIPSRTECGDCHKGRRDRMLGFEAISLGQAGATGLTLSVLAGENKLRPAPSRTTVDVKEPALALLHVNCGITCHNGNPGSTAFTANLHLRLGFDEVATKPVEDWAVFANLVNVDTTGPGRDAKRVDPGRPASSAIVTAMSHRGEGQMPPIATNLVDRETVDIVSTWIEGLP